MEYTDTTGKQRQGRRLKTSDCGQKTVAINIMNVFPKRKEIIICREYWL